MRILLIAAAVLTIGTAGNAHGQAVVGTYICAVDNCKKAYLQSGAALLDACTDGVGNASDSKPSSPGCLKMCDQTYGGKGERGACRKGCAMFPAECLRDGKVAPKEKGYDRNRGNEKWKPKPTIMPKQRGYRDRYRYWY